MKLASDFKLPFSCFSSNLGKFCPIRVEMCYIWSSIQENVEKWTLFFQILAYFDAKHSNFLIYSLYIKLGHILQLNSQNLTKYRPFYLFFFMELPE